jgi:hypothetical protein
MIIAHDIPQLRDVITEVSVRSTIKRVAATRIEFRDRADAELQEISDDPIALYAFNPLYTTPLIRKPGGGEPYIAPVPQLLLRRLADGPYYMLLDADRTTFTEAFGPVFQQYLRWELLTARSDGRLREVEPFLDASDDARVRSRRPSMQLQQLSRCRGVGFRHE